MRILAALALLAALAPASGQILIVGDRNRILIEGAEGVREVIEIAPGTRRPANPAWRAYHRPPLAPGPPSRVLIPELLHLPVAPVTPPVTAPVTADELFLINHYQRLISPCRAYLDAVMCKNRYGWWRRVD